MGKLEQQCMNLPGLRVNRISVKGHHRSVLAFIKHPNCLQTSKNVSFSQHQKLSLHKACSWGSDDEITCVGIV
jgi:hypothetical protein